MKEVKLGTLCCWKNSHSKGFYITTSVVDDGMYDVFLPSGAPSRFADWVVDSEVISEMP